MFVFATPEVITLSLTPNLVIKLLKAWYGVLIYTDRIVGKLIIYEKSLTLIIVLKL